MSIRIQIPNPLCLTDTLVLVTLFEPPYGLHRSQVETDVEEAILTFVALHMGHRDAAGNPPVLLDGNWQFDPDGPGAGPQGDRYSWTERPGHATMEMELWPTGKGHVVAGRQRRVPEDPWTYFIATEVMGLRYDPSSSLFRLDPTITPATHPKRFGGVPTEEEMKPWWVQTHRVKLSN